MQAASSGRQNITSQLISEDELKRSGVPGGGSCLLCRLRRGNGRDLFDLDRRGFLYDFLRRLFRLDRLLACGKKFLTTDPVLDSLSGTTPSGNRCPCLFAIDSRHIPLLVPRQSTTGPQGCGLRELFSRRHNSRHLTPIPFDAGVPRESRLHYHCRRHLSSVCRTRSTHLLRFCLA